MKEIRVKQFLSISVLKKLNRRRKGKPCEDKESNDTDETDFDDVTLMRVILILKIHLISNRHFIFFI